MDDTKRTEYSIAISNVNICNILKGQGEKINLYDDNESFSVVTNFEENSIAFILMKKNIRTIKQNYDKGLLSIKLTANGIEELNHFLNCEKTVDQVTNDWIDISFQNSNIDDINTLMNFFSSVIPEIINDNNIHNKGGLMIIDDNDSNDIADSKEYITRKTMKIRNKRNSALSPKESKPKENKPALTVNIEGDDILTRPKRVLRKRKNKEEQNEYDADEEKKDIEEAIKRSLKGTNPVIISDDSSPDVSKKKKKSKKMKEEDIDPYSHVDKLVILIEYPSQYLTGEIFVTMEDYLSVGRTQYLCSNIIDFYLSYIYHEKLTNEQREKVLIFPSEFFALYSTNSAFSGWKKDENVGKSAINKRFERVKGMFDCQPNMNILDKDFLIIPICQNNHWFLAIVCFPYLKNVVNYDGEMVDEPYGARKHNDNTIRLPIKQPIILTFDSLKSNPQRRVAAIVHIRKFIKSYNLYKNGIESVENSQGILTHTVICPVQPNNYDCGCFLLEFVERFLIKDPIIDYRFPIDMSKWFKSRYLGREKRNEIVNLIREKIIDPSIELPELLLFSQGAEDDVDMEINNNDDNQNKCEEDHYGNNIIDENITSDGNNEDKVFKNRMEGRNNKEEVLLTKSSLHLPPEVPEEKIMTQNKLSHEKGTIKSEDVDKSDATNVQESSEDPMETEKSDINKCDDGKTDSSTNDEKLVSVLTENGEGSENSTSDSVVKDLVKEEIKESPISSPVKVITAEKEIKISYAQSFNDQKVDEIKESSNEEIKDSTEKEDLNVDEIQEDIKMDSTSLHQVVTKPIIAGNEDDINDKIVCDSD